MPTQGPRPAAAHPGPRRVRTDHFDWSADTGYADQMRTVLRAATEADGAAPLDEEALLTLRHRGLAGSELIVAGDPMAGFAWSRDGGIDVVVHPAHRENGLGTALASAAVEAAGPVPLQVWSHGNHPGAMVLAKQLGFDRVRDLWVMRRGLADVPAPAPLPPGIRLRTFEPGRDEDAFLAVNAAAFAGHPEQGDLARDDLHRRIAERWFDPAGFFVAEPTGGGELVGFHWTKVHEGDPPFGEVYVVGVSPDAQGLGLGRALTLAGLHHLAGLGLDQVILYVEADNRPAISMYAALGFTHADSDTHVMYLRS